MVSNEYVSPAWRDGPAFGRYMTYMMAENRRMPMVSRALFQEAGSEGTGAASVLLMRQSNPSGW